MTITWTGAGDGSTWEDINNWDSLSLPLITDNVVIDGANITSSVGVCSSAIFSNGAILNGTMLGNCAFHNASYNLGSITGDCVFYDISYNAGSITGNCTFYDDSYSTASTHIGNCIFHDDSYTNAGIDGDCFFYDDSYSTGAVIGGTTYVRQRATYFIIWRIYSIPSYCPMLILQFPEMDVLGTGLL